MPVLVVNCGSSSLKYELFAPDGERSLGRGLIERIGRPNGGSRLRHERAGGVSLERAATVPDHAAAVDLMCATLVDPVAGGVSDLSDLKAVGHRVVHGGTRFTEAVWIDAAVLAEVERCVPLAPLHNPPNLAGIRACQQRLPGVPQVAVFDTAFHQTLPPAAYTYALPQELCRTYGLRRYGFHGSSHRYVSERALAWLAARGVAPADSRLVTCHLGNGCSLAAIRGGRSCETSMGFTPLEGLVMGTRAGDFDPALVGFLSERRGDSPAELDNLFNARSGLLGLSGLSHDVRDLLAAAAAGHRRARLALDVFCDRVRQYIGAYVAVLGGLDALVFTGGIGERSAPVRAQILAGLEFLGLRLEPGRNERPGPAGVISAPDSRAGILVIPTEEERVIAREVVRLLTNS